MADRDCAVRLLHSLQEPNSIKNLKKIPTVEIKKGKLNLSDSFVFEFEEDSTPNSSNLQEAFLKYRKKKQKQIKKARKKKGSAPRPQLSDPTRMWNLRMKFVEQCKSYFGVPYAKRYFEPSEDHYHSKLFLDCCGLVRRAMRDLKREFGFKIGPWNQSYMYDTLPVTVHSEGDMKPGDLVFIKATYYNPKMKRQRHDITHVEVWLGDGPKTIGARWQRDVVKVFDHYQFVAKAYHSEQYIFKSLDPWLMGRCQSHCQEHPWKSRAHIFKPTRKSVFNVPDGLGGLQQSSSTDSEADVTKAARRPTRDQQRAAASGSSSHSKQRKHIAKRRVKNCKKTGKAHTGRNMLLLDSCPEVEASRDGTAPDDLSEGQGQKSADRVSRVSCEEETLRVDGEDSVESPDGGGSEEEEEEEEEENAEDELEEEEDAAECVMEEENLSVGTGEFRGHPPDVLPDMLAAKATVRPKLGPTGMSRTFVHIREAASLTDDPSLIHISDHASVTQNWDDPGLTQSTCETGVTQNWDDPSLIRNKGTPSVNRPESVPRLILARPQSTDSLQEPENILGLQHQFSSIPFFPAASLTTQRRPVTGQRTASLSPSPRAAGPDHSLARPHTTSPRPRSTTTPRQHQFLLVGTSATRFTREGAVRLSTEGAVRWSTEGAVRSSTEGAVRSPAEGSMGSKTQLWSAARHANRSQASTPTTRDTRGALQTHRYPGWCDGTPGDAEDQGNAPGNNTSSQGGRWA